MFTYTPVNTARCAVLLLLIFTQPVLAKPMMAEAIYTTDTLSKPVTLGEASRRVSAESGIQFRFNADVEHDLVKPPHSGSDWMVVVNQLLAGYNFSIIQHERQPASVLISGRNGLRQIPEESQDIADQVSEMSLQLPLLDLLNMTAGSHMAVQLPIGQFVVTRLPSQSENDDWAEWSGKMQGTRSSEPYVLNMVHFDGNLLGNVKTPNGYYAVDNSSGYARLVAVNMTAENAP